MVAGHPLVSKATALQKGRGQKLGGELSNKPKIGANASGGQMRIPGAITAIEGGLWVHPALLHQRFAQAPEAARGAGAIADQLTVRTFAELACKNRGHLRPAGQVVGNSTRGDTVSGDKHPGRLEQDRSQEVSSLEDVYRQDLDLGTGVASAQRVGYRRDLATADLVAVEAVAGEVVIEQMIRVDKDLVAKPVRKQAMRGSSANAAEADHDNWLLWKPLIGPLLGYRGK